MSSSTTAQHQRDLAIFCEHLRQAREGAGLTQADLAQAIGRTQAFISKVERGRRRLEVVELLEVCRAMGVDSTQFMTQFQHKADASLAGTELAFIVHRKAQKAATSGTGIV